MFASKPKYQKIKCIITGQYKMCNAWYNCQGCQINYSTFVFSEYDGWLQVPKCAICHNNLIRRIISKFPGHRRR